MQTPKARNSSSEGPQRTSPSSQGSQRSSPATRAVRQLKVTAPDSNSIASPNALSRTPKKRSPKVTERGSPRNTTEKSRQVKSVELESQLTQLQDELRRAKDQWNASEAQKRQAQQEAAETKKQLEAMSVRLVESQRQLVELSASEDGRVQELRQLSQERDRAWQSELEAIQKQHSMDSVALTAARNEIQKLKRQLEMMTKSEGSHSMHAEAACAEIQSLRAELSESLALTENLRTQINDYKGAEGKAQEVAREAQEQLEATKTTVESLQSERLKIMEDCKSLSSMLEQSKAQVSTLEGLVCKLQNDMENGTKISFDVSGETIKDNADDDSNKEETRKLTDEIDTLKDEVCFLKSALEASELRYQEEYIQSTLQIRNAYEKVELAKSESSVREAKLESELMKAKGEIEELKSHLIFTETVLQNTSENNEHLSVKIMENDISSEKPEIEVELKKLREDVEDLKASLSNKETQYQSTVEENEMLREEIKRRDRERSEASAEATALTEAARAAEREALMKLGYVTEEADKSSQRVTRFSEQLDAAQTANTELEAELRRLKVQSDQWRKAAEAAAAMLSSGNNGKFVDRTVSLDSTYTIDTKMDSPLSDMDDDSPKKKNGNMLKKIGVLWKKGQR